MTTTSINTHERVGGLIALSDRVYDSIDQTVAGELRARRMLRLGISTVAHLCEMPKGVSEAGVQLHSLFVNELAHGGLSIDEPVYDHFPRYREVVDTLDRSKKTVSINRLIDPIAQRYADTPRATVSRLGSPETDATHAVHLAALALPYAAEYYPELDQGKLVPYCLLHDIVEAYCGDVTSLGASDEIMAQKHLDEMAALQQIRRDFGDSIPHFVDIVETYENLGDNEARFVKIFDKLDPGFTHLYSRGVQITTRAGIKSVEKLIEATAQTDRRMISYGHGYTQVLNDRHELLRRVIQVTDWPE